MRIWYHKIVWKNISLRHGREFLRHVIPAVLKPLRCLWNEVIGFLFLTFAVVFGFKTARYALDFAKASDAEAGGNLVRLAIAGFCTLVMGWYGLSSFLRARRISRS
jgi:hypothetical protein